jgi:hypothetical protein
LTREGHQEIEADPLLVLFIPERLPVRDLELPSLTWEKLCRHFGLLGSLFGVAVV